MKNKHAFVIGIAMAAYFAYGMYSAYLGMVEKIYFDLSSEFIIFIPLVALSLLLFWAINRGATKANIITTRLISFFSLASIILFWGISPLEDVFLLNISGKYLAINTFFYLWQEIVFGGITIIFFSFLLRPVTAFLRDYEADPKNIRDNDVLKVSSIIKRFPLQTAAIAAIVSFFGYIIGAVNFYLNHVGAPGTVAVNSLLVGIAVGQMLFAVVYFFSRSILNDANDILSSFSEISPPELITGISSKIFMTVLSCGMFFIPITLGLFINLNTESITIDMFILGVITNFIFGVGIMILIGGMFASEIINSLEQLKRCMGLVRVNDLNCRLNIKTGDEMEEVGYEFNKMVAHLKNKK